MRRAALALLLTACGGTPAQPSGSTPDGALPDAAVERDGGLLDAAAPRVIHVGANPGAADGSRDRPFPNVSAAFAAALPGDVVFLLPGDHAAAPSPPPDVELLGSGAGVTRLAGPLTLETPAARVADLTVDGGVQVRANAALARVVVEDAPGAGLRIAAGATLEDVLVRRSAGPGVEIEAGVTLDWRGGGVEAAATQGVTSTGADLRLVDLELRDVGGIGVLADGGAVRIEAVRIAGASAAGVRLIEARADVADLAVGDVRLDPAQNTAGGLEVIGGAATVRGLAVARVGDRGLRVALGAQITARDVTVTAAGEGVGVGQQARADVTGLRITGGGGISVVDAALTLADAEVDGPRRHGLLASRATVDVTGLTVRASGARGVALTAAGGTLRDLRLHESADVGLQISDPVTPVLIDGAELTDNRTSGVAVTGAAAGLVTLRAVSVGGTRTGEGELSEGIHLFRTDALLERVDSSGNGGAGLLAEEATPVVRDGRYADNGAPGLVIVDPPGVATIEGARIEANLGAGVLAVGGTVRLVDTIVAATVRDATTNAAEGVAAGSGASLSMSGGESRDNGGHGVYAFGRSSVRLDGVGVTGNAGVGAFALCDGSRVEAVGATRFAANAGGERNTCP